jgi:outer membrane receptor protein involved in Fe transport
MRPRAGKEAVLSDPLQFSVALNHNMRLKDELQTRAGLPAIDRLADSGQSRHSLSLQATAGKRGVGASLNGNWSSAARVRGVDRTFHFKPPVIFNMSMFAEPDRLFERMKGSGLMKGLKISLDIQNLFNGYRRVTTDDGAVAAGYSRDEIDPLGRTVRITLRKKF